MRSITLVAILFLLVAPAASFGLTLGVEPQARAEMNVVETSMNEGTPSTWDIEVENPGSVTLVGRVHLMVKEKNETVFEAWSDPLRMEPGTLRKTSLSYFDPRSGGERKAVLHFHYGSEVTEDRIYLFNSTRVETSPGFELRRASLYSDHVFLGLEVPRDVKEFHVTLDDDSIWRYGQERVESPGRFEGVRIDYSPEGSPGKVRLSVSGKSGKYHYTESLDIGEPSGMAVYAGKILDWTTTTFSFLTYF